VPRKGGRPRPSRRSPAPPPLSRSVRFLLFHGLDQKTGQATVQALFISKRHSFEHYMSREVPHCGFCAKTELMAGTLYVYVLPLLLTAVPLRVQAQTPTVLHKVTVAKGGLSFAGLTLDGRGHFFGTASMGGAANKGTVDTLASTGSETGLHSFTGRPDGSCPAGGLARDAAGNLYGTAQLGGGLNCRGPYRPTGCGTVFKISSKGQFTVLHAFAGAPSDGAVPANGGPLVLDANGNLYGTTSFGGP
jgi:uncharacterized repeat protein (TIGR03803 family)